MGPPALVLASIHPDAERNMSENLDRRQIGAAKVHETGFNLQKGFEIAFYALLLDSGTQEVRFERAPAG